MQQKCLFKESLAQFHGLNNKWNSLYKIDPTSPAAYGSTFDLTPTFTFTVGGKKALG